MEESLFPHGNSSQDTQGLEEERRLCYVAITRARKRLYLTNAFTRQIFGQSSANPPSRFIAEIPSELRHNIGMGSAGFRGQAGKSAAAVVALRVLVWKQAVGRVFGQSSASGSRPRQKPLATRTNLTRAKSGSAYEFC